MKTYFVTIFLLLISSIYNIEYKKLSFNIPYTFESSDKDLQYYQLSLKDSENIPNEIKIDTQIVESKDIHSSTIGFLNEPFKHKNYNKVKKTQLGNPVILDPEFIQSAIEKENNIYFAIYCEKCVYKLNIIPSGVIDSKKQFIQTPPIRTLQEEGLPNFRTNSTRMDMFSANGISGLIVAFILIFISVIGCIIMMNIYVHTNALVEQPLKLGRVEA